MDNPELVKIDGPVISGISETLAVKGVQIAPQAIDLQRVQFVYDLVEGGWSRPSLFTFVSAFTGGSIVGLSVINENLIGPQGLTYNSRTPLKTSSNQNARIQTMEAILTFNAAGATAFNGKIVRLVIKYFDVASGNTFGIVNVDMTIATALTAYRRYINADAPGWNKVVPDKVGLVMDLISVDGTVFPASTTFQISGMGMFRAVGARLPI